MIRIASKTELLPIGTKVSIINGGYGAHIANRQTGVVCDPPDDSATWPDYAGECKEDAVVFVKCQDRVYGLASGCEVEIESTEQESQEDLWRRVERYIDWPYQEINVTELMKQFTITRKP